MPVVIFLRLIPDVNELEEKKAHIQSQQKKICLQSCLSLPSLSAIIKKVYIHAHYYKNVLKPIKNMQNVMFVGKESDNTAST